MIFPSEGFIRCPKSCQSSVRKSHCRKTLQGSMGRLLPICLVLFALLCLGSLDVTEAKSPNFKSDDYYDILGLGKKASSKQIKSAYRKLALKV